MSGRGKYVLEVLRFNADKQSSGDWSEPIEHVGYMKGKFKTKKDAVTYYDKHNPHMRSLNAHNTYISDWDPNTNLLYIVRNDYFVYPTIDCFNQNDNTEVEKEGWNPFKWLK